MGGQVHTSHRCTRHLDGALTPRVPELSVEGVGSVLELSASHRLDPVSRPRDDSVRKERHTVLAGEQGDVTQVQEPSPRVGGVEERQGEQSAIGWLGEERVVELHAADVEG